MPKLIDLTGKKFGRLLVLKRNSENLNGKPAWICQCDCGKTKIIRGSDLKSGKILSCGCLQKENREKYNNRGKIEPGSVFGYLTVIKDIGLKYSVSDGSKRRYSLCKCICGKEIEVKNHSLLLGQKKSCGCMQYKNKKGTNIKNLAGQKFNSLTVLKDSGQRDNQGSVLWLCKCKCGRLTKISTNNIKKQKTCGKCLNKQSYGVQQIGLLLRQNNLNYEREKIMPGSLNPKTKGTPRFDFFVDNDYFIEFDGKQHFEIGQGIFDNEEQFLKTQERD